MRLRLAGLTQHPADGLADEELALLEHALRVTREATKVAFATTQRPQQR
jgi:hypothetical protein